jgi:hypothetical protein
LTSVCLPASVETLGRECFANCFSLSEFAFESGSRLNEIKEYAFGGCSSLKSLSLPASLQKIDGSALPRTVIAALSVEDGNRSFRVSILWK